MSNIKNTKKHLALEKTKKKKKYKDNTYMDSCNIHYQAVWNTYKYSKKRNYSKLGAILPRQSFNFSQSYFSRNWEVHCFLCCFIRWGGGVEHFYNITLLLPPQDPSPLPPARIRSTVPGVCNCQEMKR